MPSIHSIVYQPRDRRYGKRKGDYIRVALGGARLIPQHGIEGDQKAGHHPERNLNLLSLEWLNGLQAQGYKTAPGQFGEQIIVSGLAVEELAPGARLQLGDEAIIEITKLRTGCDRLAAAQTTSLDKIEGLGALGAMARVITGGLIAVGDEVREVARP